METTSKYDGHSFNACEEHSRCDLHKEPAMKIQNIKMHHSTTFLVKLEGLPEEVQKFVLALVSNAMEAHESWCIFDMNGGQCFAETIPYIQKGSDGSVSICDNYERSFDTVYSCKDGVWTVRNMFNGEPARPYTFVQAISDANMMFTG